MIHKYCRRAGIFFLNLLWLIALAPHAQAQALREERELLQLPVDERAPEDFRKPPITYKGFFIRPEIELETRYDSNIFAASEDKRDDIVAAVRPGISALKLFNAHSFLVRGTANIQRFARESSEDKEEFSGFFRGRLDLGGRWSAPFSLNLAKRVRDRTSPRSQGFATEPLAFTTSRISGGASREFGRFALTLLGDYSRLRYDDGVSAQAGTPVIFSDNDRDIAGARLQMRYGIPRGLPADGFEHILFLNYGIEKQQFKRLNFVNGSFSGVSEDNLKQGFLAGFETDYKGLLFANLGAGYFVQNYDDPRLDKTAEIDFNANVAWNVMPKLTLLFEAGRDSDQNNDFLGGLIRTDYKLGFDYELKHDWYIGGAFTYADFDFSDNAETDRQEEDYLAELRLRHLINRSLEAELELSHQSREANIPDNEFDRTIFLLRLTGRL